MVRKIQCIVVITGGMCIFVGLQKKMTSTIWYYGNFFMSEPSTNSPAFGGVKPVGTKSQVKPFYLEGSPYDKCSQNVKCSEGASEQEQIFIDHEM